MGQFFTEIKVDGSVELTLFTQSKIKVSPSRLHGASSFWPRVSNIQRDVDCEDRRETQSVCHQEAEMSICLRRNVLHCIQLLTFRDWAASPCVLQGPRTQTAVEAALTLLHIRAPSWAECTVEQEVKQNVAVE